MNIFEKELTAIRLRNLKKTHYYILKNEVKYARELEYFLEDIAVTHYLGRENKLNSLILALWKYTHLSVVKLGTDYTAVTSEFHENIFAQNIMLHILKGNYCWLAKTCMEKEYINDSIFSLIKVDGIVDMLTDSNDYEQFMSIVKQVEQFDYHSNFNEFVNSIPLVSDDLSKLDKEPTEDLNFMRKDGHEKFSYGMFQIYKRLVAIYGSSYEPIRKKGETTRNNKKEERIFIHVLNVIKSKLIGSGNFTKKYIENNLSHYLDEAVLYVKDEDSNNKELIERYYSEINTLVNSAQ